jgi:hypothetical protein
VRLRFAFGSGVEWIRLAAGSLATKDRSVQRRLRFQV